LSFRFFPQYSERSGLRDYFVAFISTSITAGICFPLASSIGYQTVGLIFLMIVSLLSLFLGRSALIFAAILNFIVWNFFFITPLYTFRVHSLHDLIALFANLIVAIVGSTLISRIRKSQITLLKSQERLTILHTFLESLNNATSIKEVVKRAQEGLRKNFKAEIIIYIKEKTGSGLSGKSFGNSELHSDLTYDVALSLFRESYKELFTPLIESSSGMHFYPLVEPRKAIGVIGIKFSGDNRPEEDKLILLKSFIAQIASALDREISIDLAKEKEISIESEKLFQTVLNSVSHELRTPISIITAAVSNLNDERTSSDPDLRRQIGEELEFASDRLNYLVENILDMSRIESGFLKLNLQYCDISDLIGISINELKHNLMGRQVKICIEEKLPLIHADINLLKQALINVLHNAMVYTPSDSPIMISSFFSAPGKIAIRVSDFGTGVSPELLNRLFDKFYRVPGSKSGGTGLGLTITKAIVEAHNGVVLAENADQGGLQITMVLNMDIQNGKSKEQV